MIDHLFLSVGTMKAGTTWLNRMMMNHPDVYFSPEKEIHFFADPDGTSGPMTRKARLERYQRVVRNLKVEGLSPRARANLSWYANRYLDGPMGAEWYEALFVRRKGQRYCADFSNLYATLSAERWAYARTVASSIRAVYTMRHPIERLWSQVKFELEFNDRGEAVRDLTAEDFDAFFARPDVAANADYAGVVQSLRNCLSGEELKIDFFEDVRADPLGALRRIERFLGIREHTYREDQLGRQVNPSKPAAMPDAFLRHAEPIHQRQVEQLTALGLRPPRAWDLVPA